MATSLQTYRSLVPSHASVPDVTIEAWLEVAANAHDSTAFGTVFVPAMVMYAAAHLEPQVVSGQFPVDSHGNICAPPKVDPEAPAVKVPKIDETSFWQAYLRFVRSRAAVAPFHVGPGTATGLYPSSGPFGWVT